MYGCVRAARDLELLEERQRRALLHLVTVHLALVLEREPGWPNTSKTGALSWRRLALRGPGGQGRGTHARGRFEPRCGQLCHCQDDRVSTLLASLRNLEAILLHALQRCE